MKSKPIDSAPTAPTKEHNEPFTAIAIRSFKGVVRGAKVEGMKNPAFTKTRKVLHLGMFVKRDILDRRKGLKVNVTTTKTVYEEVENLAEFDGPTCEDACKSFLAIFKKSTRSNGATCIADGKVVPVKLWKKLDSVQAVELNA